MMDIAYAQGFMHVLLCYFICLKYKGRQHLEPMAALKGPFKRAWWTDNIRQCVVEVQEGGLVSKRFRQSVVEV